MKTLISTAKENLKRSAAKTVRFFQRISAAVCATLVTAAASPMSVFATETTQADLPTLVGRVLGSVLSIFMYGGIVLAIFSAIQLVIAVKDENPDKQQKAIWGLIAGVILTVIKSFVKAVFNQDNGFDIVW